MAVSVKLVLRKDKVNKLGLVPIHFRITKNRKSSYVASGKYIRVNEWDEKNNKVKTTYKNSTRLNHYLMTKLTELHNDVLELETTQKLPTGLQLKQSLYGKQPLEFFPYSEAINQKNLLEGKVSTFDKNSSILKKLKNYVKGKKITFQEITPAFLNEYEAYLRARGNKTNTIHKDMRYIRKLFNDAYREELIDHHTIPFNRYKMKTEKTVRDYLNDDEILLIEQLPLLQGTKIDLHRDMFVFASYAAGLRVSDVLTIKWKDYDGEYLHVTVNKTKGQLSIKLPNKAIAILNKYNKGNSNPTDYIFPMVDNSVTPSNARAYDLAVSRATACINKSLKLIAKKCKIEKRLSFHISRHSFATRALTKGISIDKVSKLLGHSNIATTQIYAKIVNSELDKAMDVFN